MISSYSIRLTEERILPMLDGQRVSGTEVPSLRRCRVEFGALLIAPANSAKTHEAAPGGLPMDMREPPSGGAFV